MKLKLPRNVFQLLVMLESAVLVAPIIFGIIHTQRSAVKTADKPVSNVQSEKNDDREKFTAKKEDAEDTVDETELPKELTPVTFSEEVTTKIAAMTLEEKVAQMFLITPESLTHTDTVEVAGESTKAAVNACPVGGLVYASANFKNNQQTQALLSGVQQYSNERIGLPMFLAIQEIGGSDNSPLAAANGLQQQRSPAEIGAGGNPEEAAQAADGIASYMMQSGFNLNLMPVAELAGGTDTAHDSICYGADASTASAMVAEAVNASLVKGLYTAIGTFPGKEIDGSTEEGWEAWKNSNALVFQSSVNAGTDCIIMSNVTCEKLTGEAELLCSMSNNAVYYLRNDLGYTGILMTDSLSEESVTARYSPSEAAVAAVKSGINIVYCPANFEEAYQAVLSAVNNNEIPVETINQAVGYILTLKFTIADGA